MPMMARLLSLWRNLIHKNRVEQELDGEVRAYLEMLTEEKIKAGMSPEEAPRAARMELGGVEQVKEQVREIRMAVWLETLFQDVRYALRTLAKNPGFTAVIIVTLALGIGANTAIFTLVDAVMLKSLPVASPNQLYRLGDSDNCCEMTGLQGSFVLYAYPLYRQLRDHTPEFSELAAFTPFLTDLSARRNSSSGPAEPYQGEFVSGNYFTIFGIGALAGRALAPADDVVSAPPVAVMNYHTWQQRFGLDPSIIGATFTINRVPYTVVGVAPPGFYGDTLRSDPPDFWLPLSTEPALDRQNSMLNRANIEWLYPIGRIKPGAKPAKVQSHLTLELQQWLWVRGWANASPQERKDIALVDEARREIARQHIRLTPARGGVDTLHENYAAGLRLLILISGLILVIACANVANLLVARGAASRLQIAVRVALGATRQRLIRQMLTESILLAALGGAAGLLVALDGTHMILLLAFRGAHFVPISASPSITVIAFAFLLSVATGIVFGALPAWAASHTNPADALHGAGRSTRDRSSRARKSLVVVQVALSLVLLTVAGLLTESLRNLQDQQFGFVTRGRLMVKVQPALAGYTPGKLYGLYQQLQQRLLRIPGVLSASLSNYSPMEGGNWNEDVYIEGRTPGENSNQDQNSSLDRVSSHYFETIGTRLLRGRVIDDGDTPGSRHVAVVNQTFVRKFFPKQNPIGQHFGLGDASHSGDYEIVGVVEDAKYQNARVPAYPTAFMPLLQTPTEKPGHDSSIYIGDIELHVAGVPGSFESKVRRTLAGIDPNLTVLKMMSFKEQVSLNFNQERLIARLTELFGLLALILACVGLYGVTAYSVGQRTNEIGIRMALGASRVGVMSLVLKSALVQVVLGMAIGAPVAIAGSRVLASLLYGVKGTDPLILGLAAVILTTCALVAALIPARRATQVDPMMALRCE